MSASSGFCRLKNDFDQVSHFIRRTSHSIYSFQEFQEFALRLKILIICIDECQVFAVSGRFVFVAGLCRLALQYAAWKHEFALESANKNPSLSVKSIMVRTGAG